MRATHDNLPSAHARWAVASLRALLLLIRLENDGRAFEPTALRPRGHSAPRGCTGNVRTGIPATLAAREEPEIHLAWLTLRSILVDFELLVGEQVVEPDAFSLRCVEDWAFPQDSPAAMLAALSRPCPYRCAFCYEGGLPDAARPLVRPVASEAELEERFTLWRRRLDLPGFRGLRYGEVLPHPRFADAMRVIREVADQPIAVATAGAGLTDEKLQALAGRPRVLLQLSLNSCEPASREQLMGDRRADELLRLLPRFRELDVAWAASAVAWPGLPLDELEATIRAAEAHGALHFVVFLPSFSKYFPLRPAFDWEVRWQETTTFVRELRRRVRIPIRIAPDAWEAAHGLADPLAIEVIGTTVGSAAEGRLRAGDLLTDVQDADEPITRASVSRVLEEAWRSARPVRLNVLRDGRSLPVELRGQDGATGHPGELDAPFGVHLYGGPDAKHLARVVELLRFAGARRGWVLGAQLLAEPYARLWSQARESLGAEDLDLRFVPVANRFWGGNILVGDLLTADDFVATVREERNAGRQPPDVLLVPFSPFHPTYWRDLTGASFLQIERQTGLPTFPLVTGSPS